MSTEPIIRPLWLYLIDILDKLSFITCLIIILSMVILVFLIPCYCSDKNYGWDKDAKAKEKPMKILAILIAIALLITIPIPSKQTMYTMLIADQVTPANIQYVGDTVEDCVDYMFDKVDDLIHEGDADE